MTASGMSGVNSAWTSAGNSLIRLCRSAAAASCPQPAVRPMKAGKAAAAMVHFERLCMTIPSFVCRFVLRELFRERSPPSPLASWKYSNLIGIPAHRDLVAFPDARCFRQQRDQPIPGREQEIGPIVAATKREHLDLGTESIVTGRIICADPQL